jgi:hypothetical protein
MFCDGSLTEALKKTVRLVPIGGVKIEDSF